MPPRRQTRASISAAAPPSSSTSARRTGPSTNNADVTVTPRRTARAAAARAAINIDMQLESSEEEEESEDSEESGDEDEDEDEEEDSGGKGKGRTTRGRGAPARPETSRQAPKGRDVKVTPPKGKEKEKEKGKAKDRAKGKGKGGGRTAVVTRGGAAGIKRVVSSSGGDDAQSDEDEDEDDEDKKEEEDSTTDGSDMYNIEEEYMPRPKDRSTWPKTARTLEAQLAQERRIGGEYQKYMEYSRRRLARSEAKAKASKARMDAANKEAKANAGPSASAVEAGKEKETGWSAKEAPSTREWIERVQENKREIEKRRREGAAGASSSPSANLPAAAPASVSAGPTMGIESVSGTGVSAGPPTSRGRAAARGFMGANVPVSMPAPPPVAASLPSASQASAAPSAVYPSAPPTAPAAPPEPKGGALRIKLKLPANGGAGAEGSGSGSGSSSRAGGSTKGNASVGARSTAKGRAGASIAKRGPMAQRGATRAFVGRGRRVAFPQDEEEEDSEEEDEDDQEEEEGEEDDEDAEGDEDDDVDVDGEGDAEGDVDVDVESEDVEGEITFYRNVDVESEDSEDDDSEGGGKDRPARPLTTRQAVLASMVDSSHVSLDGAAIPGSGAGGRRKKQLTEMEMKLRREETARKRKNLSEKKLEDEKAETINRLLKKQTRPRARRTNTTDSVGTGSVTPVGRAGKARGSALGGSRLKATTGDEPDEDGEEELVEGEEGEGEEWEDEGVRDEPKPTWVRWVSRVVNVPEQAPAAPSSADSMEVDGAAVKALERRMVLSLSLPSSLVQGVEAGRTGKTGGGEEAMDVDGEVGRAPRVEGCAVDGCSEKRKYRLVRDWTRGACGMAHLKILEGMV